MVGLAADLDQYVGAATSPSAFSPLDFLAVFSKPSPAWRMSRPSPMSVLQEFNVNRPTSRMSAYFMFEDTIF